MTQGRRTVVRALTRAGLRRAGSVGAWLGTVLGVLGATAVWCVMVTRHYPDTRGLNRLYAAVFSGLVLATGMMFWAFMAPRARHRLARSWTCLLLLAPTLWWGGAP